MSESSQSGHASVPATPSTKQCDLIIDAGWVLPIAPTNQVLTAHSVVINNGRIHGIGPTNSIHAQFLADQLISRPNHLVMPGLINAHGHAAMILLRGIAEDASLQSWLSDIIWPLEAKHADAQFVAEGSRLAMLSMLRTGTTCFSDMYFYPEVVAEAASQAGMRAQIAFPVIDMANAWSPNGTEALHQGLALYDEWRHQSLVQIAFGPHGTYTNSAETLRQTLMYADELDANIQIHLQENPEELRAAIEQYGQSAVSWLNELGLLGPRLQAVHMTQLAPGDLELLAATGTHLVHCPHSNLKLASGWSPITELTSAGCNVALGTDGAASNNSLDMFTELRIAALLAKHEKQDPAALSTANALYMATLGGAKALGIEKDVGSVEVGKCADLIAIDLSDALLQPIYDPMATLVYGNAGHAVTDCWVNGEQLMRNNTMLTLDQEAVVANAQQQRNKVQGHA